jgi:transposase InsO family protein
MQECGQGDGRAPGHASPKGRELSIARRAFAPFAGPIRDLAVVAMEVVPPGLSWLAVVARPTPSNSEPRMDSHENARTTPHGRMLIVRRLAEGQSVSAVAAALGLSAKTVRKWRDRFTAEGLPGLRDRSAKPLCSPRRLPPETTAQIEALRRQRRTGPAIARQLGLATSTVGLVLRRLGLNRLKALDPKPEIIRYEREHPGELVHINIKKLGRIDGIGHRITGDRHGQSGKRGTGWEFLHVAIDDASRLAFTAMMPHEKKESAVAFLDAAITWFKAHGVTTPSFTEVLRAAEVRISMDGRGRWMDNVFIERLWRSLKYECVYLHVFETGSELRAGLTKWIGYYNAARPHSGLGGQTPDEAYGTGETMRLAA